MSKKNKNTSKKNISPLKSYRMGQTICLNPNYVYLKVSPLEIELHLYVHSPQWGLLSGNPLDIWSPRLRE